MIKKWFKKFFKKKSHKMSELYEYRIRLIMKDVISLYDNTWDKDKVKSIILQLAMLDMDSYSLDNDMKVLIYEKFNKRI